MIFIACIAAVFVVVFAAQYPPVLAILIELAVGSWGAYTIYCWATNKAIPIRGSAKISTNSPSYIRIVGLLIGFFYIVIGIVAFYQTI